MTATDLDQRTHAVYLLARGYSSDKAGALVGVSARTIRRWVADTDFKAEVVAARRELLGEAVGAISAAAKDAVDVLHRALSSDSENTRIRAAQVLLSNLPSLGEYVELDARVAELEARLAEQGGAL